MKNILLFWSETKENFRRIRVQEISERSWKNTLPDLAVFSFVINVNFESESFTLKYFHWMKWRNHQIGLNFESSDGYSSFLFGSWLAMSKFGVIVSRMITDNYYWRIQLIMGSLFSLFHSFFLKWPFSNKHERRLKLFTASALIRTEETNFEW